MGKSSLRGKLISANTHLPQLYYDMRSNISRIVVVRTEKGFWGRAGKLLKYIWQA
jgi:predicted alternative tryptophan synthase beta-subunit